MKQNQSVTTVDQFIALLKKYAGKRTFRVTPTGCLRTKGEHCPIRYVLNRKFRRQGIRALNTSPAEQLLGMDIGLRTTVINGADNDLTGSDGFLASYARRRMLEVLGLA